MSYHNIKKVSDTASIPYILYYYVCYLVLVGFLKLRIIVTSQNTCGYISITFLRSCPKDHEKGMILVTRNFEYFYRKESCTKCA